MKNTTAFIFARSGSKGLKDKNIKDFAGKPLIAHTITAALESKIFNDVVVSTNSKRIATISESYGASVPFLRPKNLSESYIDLNFVLKFTLEKYSDFLEYTYIYKSVWLLFIVGFVGIVYFISCYFLGLLKIKNYKAN